MTHCADFSPEFFADLIIRAEHASRRRMHHNVHATHDDPVQRLFNAICLDSYIRPHRHLLDRKHELLMAVRGRFALVLFNEDGTEADITFLSCRSDEAVAAEIAPAQWHTIIAIEPGSVLFEVKSGPFDSSLAKEQAEWSPEEGTPEAFDYLEQLRVKALSR